jgi:hypothetical protein
MTTPGYLDMQRLHTAYDLEVTLVKFLTTIFSGMRLDNPTLNLAQPGELTYDVTERAQTLIEKQPPRVLRGRIPRTVTGAISLDKLPDCPAIIVEAISAKVEITETTVTTHLLFSAYDENPDGSGYQDVLNMMETASIALTSFGQGAIDQAYPIVMPINWNRVEPDCFPHHLGEMTCQWELPSARPMPDLGHGIIPAEHIELRLQEIAADLWNR